MTIGPTFFASIRSSLFGGSLSQSQVDGIIAITEEWGRSGDGDDRKLAYILATTFHETAETMQPIREIGLGKTHAYGKIDQTGKAPYGRGYCQITFRDNYVKMDEALGLGGRLAANYDLALDPKIAAPAIVVGMMRGLFTGKKLGDYFNPTSNRPTDARAIVNGSDRAALIAGYHLKFLSAITGGKMPAPPPVAKPPAPPHVPVATGAVGGAVMGGAAFAGGVPWYYAIAFVVVGAAIAYLIWRHRK